MSSKLGAHGVLRLNFCIDALRAEASGKGHEEQCHVRAQALPPPAVSYHKVHHERASRLVLHVQALWAIV